MSNNVGFRIKISDIYTYSQNKIGFNYFFCKREVLADGVSTKPLDITLSPWESTNLVVDMNFLRHSHFIFHHPLFVLVILVFFGITDPVFNFF